jgi:hypothetical protein
MIVIGAGNMLVGGLYEAHLDCRIMKYTKDMAHGTDEDKLRIKRELLVTVASGNLMLEKGNPQKSIPASLTIPGEHAPKDGYEKARSRLLNLLGAQSRFGEPVGSPVLFYLGTFLYTTLDLRNSLSDEDTAISLGFGIEVTNLFLCPMPRAPYFTGREHVSCSQISTSQRNALLIVAVDDYCPCCYRQWVSPGKQ